MQLTEWIDLYRDSLVHCIHPVDSGKMDGWKLSDGKIKRDDGAFFTIEGYGFKSNFSGHQQEEALLINQPETGILGFLIAVENDQTFILCQAKSEPGNVHVTQIGPSVQATVSNYQRKHGGLPQPYLSFFTELTGPPVISVKQSEQGYRFLDKYNLNTVVQTEKVNIDITGNKYRWYNIEDIAANINRDFLFNTDFKSVFASLLEMRIIQKLQSFKPESLFLNSYIHYQEKENVIAAYQQIKILRNKTSIQRNRIPIERLNDWHINDNGVVPTVPLDYGVGWFDVTLEDREVGHWQQPLFVKSSMDTSVLFYYTENNAYHFIFRTGYEPGFRNKIQLAPTMSDTRGNINLMDIGTVTHKFQQSDEGGRFFQNISEYVLLEVKNVEPFRDCSGYCVLNVFSICQLLKIPGVFTNETRTLVAALHGWL
jgi:oxidase EvaA